MDLGEVPHARNHSPVGRPDASGEAAASMLKQCQAILKRQHLKRLIRISLPADQNGLPRLHYELDSVAQ
jgi:hypothetical protein